MSTTSSTWSVLMVVVVVVVGVVASSAAAVRSPRWSLRPIDGPSAKRANEARTEMLARVSFQLQ